MARYILYCSWTIGKTRPWENSEGDYSPLAGCTLRAVSADFHEQYRQARRARTQSPDGGICVRVPADGLYADVSRTASAGGRPVARRLELSTCVGVCPDILFRRPCPVLEEVPMKTRLRILRA